MSNSGIKDRINKFDGNIWNLKIAINSKINLKNSFIRKTDPFNDQWILMSGSLLLNVLMIYVQFSKVAIIRYT